MSRLGLAFSALVVVAAPVIAFAGIKGSGTVYVNQTSRYAYGALGAARNSPDNLQRVNCQFVGYAPGMVTNNVFASCAFTTSAGVNAYCFTQEPTIATAIQAMSSDSYVNVNWNEQGRCTSIQIRNDSFHEPKAP